MTVQSLHYTVAAGFVLLGLASVRDWARYRDRSHGWLATALGLLGLTTLIGLLPNQLPIVAQLSLVAFMGSGYALVRFRACFLPLTRRWNGAVLVVVAVSTALALLLPPSGGHTPRYTPPQLAVVYLLIAVWSGCVGEPATRFWLASRGRPAVQRARLRALSVGYAGIVGVLVFALAASALAASSSSTSVAIMTQVVALAMVPPLYAGFAPPGWLRSLWRQKDEESYRRATHELLLFAPDTRTIMERALEWATRLVGADAGVVAWRQGQVLAARNLDDAGASALARRLVGSPDMLPVVARRDRLLVVPILAQQEGATLIVVAGPFTPLFGSDEVGRLEHYATLMALAMSRVRLVEELARQTEALRQSEAAQATKYAVTAALASATSWAEAAPSVMSSICGAQGWELAEYWAVDADGDLWREHAWCAPASDVLGQAGPPRGQVLAAEAWSSGHTVWGCDAATGGGGGRQRENGSTPGEGEVVAFPITGGGRTAGVMTLYGREQRRPDEEMEVALADVGSRIAHFLDRKAADESIRALNEELGLRVAERTASNRELEAFVYTVSHDLRAPLRAIDGFVAALIEDYRAELPAGAREFLDDVAANARRMGQLIDDLLAFSRLNRQLPKRHRVQPGAIAAEVMERLKPELSGRQVAIAIDRLPSCTADPALLSQVYANLLSNAVKYTRRRERAEIRVGHRRDAAGVAYFVRDNGVGFDPAYAGKLFGVFQRLHSADEYEGTGVGLAIVQRIIQRHGGEVWAESAVDQGATFFFRLKGAETSERE